MSLYCVGVAKDNRDVAHETVVLLEPEAMASPSGAFLAWAQGESLS